MENTDTRTKEQFIADLDRALHTDNRFGRAQPADRFWPNIDKGPGHGPDGDCWIWTGSRMKGYNGSVGYGQMGLNAFWGKPKGGPTRTHVVSWMLVHGPVPDGKDILHSCDNPPCCNPAHLRAGTQKQNMADAQARGRARIRISSTACSQRRIRLTPPQLRILQDARRQRGLNIYQVAEMLEIDFSGFYRAELGDRPFSLEHYHFLTRFYGLDEQLLFISPEQFYERGPEGQKAGPKVGTKRAPVQPPLGYLTINQFAAERNVTRQTVINWARAGYLNVLPKRRGFFIHQRELQTVIPNYRWPEKVKANDQVAQRDIAA